MTPPYSPPPSSPHYPYYSPPPPSPPPPPHCNMTNYTKPLPPPPPPPNCNTSKPPPPIPYNCSCITPPYNTTPPYTPSPPPNGPPIYIVKYKYKAVIAVSVSLGGFLVAFLLLAVVLLAKLKRSPSTILHLRHHLLHHLHHLHHHHQLHLHINMPQFTTNHHQLRPLPINPFRFKKRVLLILVVTHLLNLSQSLMIMAITAMANS
ncbi:hypothetical protein ACSQ67_018150 [Phaseolus vulgaris]